MLTGGNDLAALGGYATERDATENALLDAVELRGLPVLGVYRGMQLIQQRCAIPLRRVTGHVTTRQTIYIDGGPAEVNSYHRFAALESRPPLEVWAVAADGVVKAICRSASSITGIMWHPEGNTPFALPMWPCFTEFSTSRDARLDPGRGAWQSHGHLG